MNTVRAVRLLAAGTLLLGACMTIRLAAADEAGGAKAVLAIAAKTPSPAKLQVSGADGGKPAADKSQAGVPSNAQSSIPVVNGDPGTQSSPKRDAGNIPSETQKDTPFVRPPYAGRIVFLYTFLLVAFVFGTIVWDMQNAYRAAGSIREKVFSKLGHGAAPEQLKLLAAELGQSITGIAGLGRSTLAFALLLILGIVVFHLVTFGGPGFIQGETGKLVHDLVMLLAGGVTSITAFYFGGRAVQEGAAGVPPAPLPSPNATHATIIRVIPDSGKAGASVTIVGTGFGQKQGHVRFGSADCTTIKSWSETLIEASVPSGLPHGATTVTVNPTDGVAVTSTIGAFNIAT